MYTEELVSNSIGRQYWVYKDDLFYQQRIKNAGPYQKQNLLRLRELKPKARTILDIGMNIGMNSIEYATWAENVHGFEPTKQTYNMALKNIALAQAQTDADMVKPWHMVKTVNFNGKQGSSLEVTGNIQTYNIGLGNIPGQYKILIKKNNAIRNQISNTSVLLHNRHKEDIETQNIEVTTVDSMNFKDVDIIKIDTEGYEFPVVLGAEQTILKYKPIVQVEIVEGQPERFGYNCQTIYDWFLERNFIITLSDGTNCGTKWAQYAKKTEEFPLSVVERFFIHKDLLNDPYVSTVAIKTTNTVPISKDQ